MFRIYCLDNKTFEPDLFDCYEEAVQMIRYFIADDYESFTEPEHTYGVVDADNKLVCIIKNNTYINLKSFDFTI